MKKPKEEIIFCDNCEKEIKDGKGYSLGRNHSEKIDVCDKCFETYYQEFHNTTKKGGKKQNGLPKRIKKTSRRF